MNAPVTNVVPIKGEGMAAREPPAFTAAEQELLGALIMNPRTYTQVATFLKPDHFFEEVHRRIYRAFVALVAEGRPPTLITLLPLLGDHPLGEGMTMSRYLARLLAEGGMTMHAGDYGRMIVDAAARRAVIGAAQELIEDAHDPSSGKASDVVTRVEGALFDVRTEFLGSSTSRRLMAGDAAATLVERAELIRTNQIVSDSVSTGLTGIDQLTGGYEPGMLWLVGARPGMGKTVVMVTSANKVASKGFGVREWSLEVPGPQIISRHLADLAFSSHNPLPFNRIYRGEVSDDEMRRMRQAQRRLAEMPLVIDDSSNITLSDIASATRREADAMARAGHPLKVVFIDYLKFIKATDRYKGNRVQEIGEISAGLKQLAKDVGVCVVLLAQLNRGVEGRDDKRPTLADLRDSGDLEADADVVLFLYREAYYLEKDPKFRSPHLDGGETVNRFLEVKNNCEAIICKSRMDATGTAQLWTEIGCSTMSMRDRGEGAW